MHRIEGSGTISIDKQPSSLAFAVARPWPDEAVGGLYCVFVIGLVSTLVRRGQRKLRPRCKDAGDRLGNAAGWNAC